MDTPVERLLATLVAMPTITDDAGANEMALDYIEDFVRSRGMHTERFQSKGHGALWASTPAATAKHPKILLAGHVDVVSGTESMFSLKLVDGKLKGRGVFDMKFAVAGYMQLVDELQGRLDQYDFCILITTDEEYGGRDGINGVVPLMEAGYRADICLLPDSTSPGWQIEKIAKGFWRFDLIATGRAAHGSRPWEGESASFKLVHALHDLNAVFKDHGPLTDTINVGLIHGGDAFNQLPVVMTAGVEIRLADDESIVRNQHLLAQLCEKHDLTIETRVIEPPLKQDLSLPLMQAYMDSVEQVTGRRPEPYVSLAASDAPYFSQYGIPCILSCPNGGRHHSEEEWLDQAGFLQFVPILHTFIEHAVRAPATPVDNPRHIV